MKKNVIFIYLLIIIATLISCKSQEKIKKITFATDATWPPMEMMTVDNSIVGFDIDFATAISKPANFKANFKNITWENIFKGLINNEYDAIISSLTITTERKQILDFSTPYINAGQVIVAPSHIPQLNSPKSLQGKTIGAQIDTTGAQYISELENCNLKTYPDLSIAANDLSLGKIDYIICDNPIAANYVEKYKTTATPFKIISPPLTDEFYAIAVKKGNKKTLEVINRGIENIVGTEEFSKLRDKWNL